MVTNCFQTPQSCYFSNRSLFLASPRPVSMEGIRVQSPKLFCTQKKVFQIQNKNKNCDPIKSHLALPKLTAWLRTCPDLRSWILGKDWKTVNPSVSGRNGIFAEFRIFPGVILHNEVRSCEIRKAMNVEPLLRIERSQLRWFDHVTRMSNERFGGSSVAGCTHRKGAADVVKGPDGMNTYPSLLGPVFRWSQQNYLRLPSLGCCLCDPPQRKCGSKNTFMSPKW